MKVLMQVNVGQFGAGGGVLTLYAKADAGSHALAAFEALANVTHLPIEIPDPPVVKSPGQVAYEVFFQISGGYRSRQWDELPGDVQSNWERIAAAARGAK